VGPNVVDVVISDCGLLALEYENQILISKKKNENIGLENKLLNMMNYLDASRMLL
jgi:hypothetical protein